LEAASKLNQEFERESARLEKDGKQLLDAVRGEVNSLSIHKREFEAFDERLRILQTSVGDAESRMLALTAKDKNLVELAQQIDALHKRFESLFAQADDLTKKQLSLESLRDRLAQVDELSKRTSWQMDALRQSREDLDVLSKEIQEFYTSHAEAAKLADKLGADRLALETFTDRMTAFASQTPELEAKMDAILGKLKLVDEGAEKATRLHETVAELDAQLSRVSARVPFVEKLETRLNGLNALSADVDQKLADQLARRAELDTLKTALDGVAAQMVDTQHKLEAVRRLETTLVPLVAEVNRLRTEITASGE